MKCHRPCPCTQSWFLVRVGRFTYSTAVPGLTGFCAMTVGVIHRCPPPRRMDECATKRRYCTIITHVRHRAPLEQNSCEYSIIPNSSETRADSIFVFRSPKPSCRWQVSSESLCRRPRQINPHPPPDLCATCSPPPRPSKSSSTCSFPLQVIEFLHRVLDIMGDYLGGNVDESAIKESFSLVYQLLEEMMDNGYPLTTEPNALKAMIRPPTTFVRMVTAATGKVRK